MTDFTITTTVTDKQVAGLLCTAFEGGMTAQWCRIMRTRKPRKPRWVLDAGRQDGQAWPIYDYPVSGGATVCRLDDGQSSDTDQSYKPLVLDRAAIERGLAIMAAKYTNHWTAFLNEQDDAITGDVFVQCCLLGSIVYG